MVWLITIVAVLLIYLLYTLIVGSPDIRIDRNAESDVDIEVPRFGAQTGETKVGNVERARFTVLDEETKKLKRVFGFEKLLNPDHEEENWKLQKPYMDIYDEEFFCRIESDRGEVQVETVAGKYTPTNAELFDNVVIKVHPVGQSKMVETTIYLDSLVYNSERSDFSTNGPVKIISQEGTLEGTGLLLIYNDELTRIEFLRIFELDYLNLNNISRISSPAQVNRQSATLETAENSADVQVKPQISSEELKPLKIAARDVRPVVSSSAQTPAQADLYNCRFDEEVVVEYAAELVATGAEYIAVNNILWAESSEHKKTDEDATDIDASQNNSSNIKTQMHSKTKPAVLETDAPVRTSRQNAAEVIVTCRGGLVLKPKGSLIGTNEVADFVQAGLRGKAGSGPAQNDAAGEHKPDLYAKYTSGLTLDADVAEDDGPAPSPALFGAERIDYDMTTGNAIAAGPVNFKFYSEVDSRNEFSDGPVPLLITADKSTKFFAGVDRTVNRIVFNGNVVGARNTLTPAYLQKDSFFGQQLIVDLKPARDSSAADIKHITVKDGIVKLESERMVHDLTINHVRLNCTRIDYGMDDDIVIATGPGDIQINNEHAPTLEKDTGSKLSLKRPCFALVYGYDKLHWFVPENCIIADGKSNSVNISYLPIVDGRRGQIVRASTSHLQADFVETISGRSELAILKTAGGIHYEEEGSHEFIGDTLFLNAPDSLMTISGSQERSCFANGALVPGIQYNLQTGKIKTKLSTSPGVISLPSRKR